MENYSVVLMILAIMIGLSAFSDKLKLPTPVLLISAGIIIGFIPSMPEVQLDPQIIFLIFLPPLLFEAAFHISWPDFRTHLNTISTLAFSLVFLTTSGIAVVAHYVIPGMTWPLSFVLGAMLAATDAVAAMSVTKDLHLPHKTTTILEGESLINDSSSLVAYNFGIAAIAGVSFVFWKAGLQFVYVLAGGFLVGWVMGKVLVYLMQTLRNNREAVIAFMLLTPFVTYLLAEAVKVSPVIAVVILGLVVSRFTKKVDAPEIKAQSKAFWDIIIYLLNGLIFILMGLEFPYVVRHLHTTHLLLYTGYALLITVVAIGIRMARVFLQRVNLARAFRKHPGRVSEDALLDVKTCLIISWSGMRGIVSLAVALGLPLALPERNAMIYITVTVVLFTLFGQGLTLPWLVRVLKYRSPT
jgi:CPA1 family monovalent cation:H+ antiporter